MMSLNNCASNPFITLVSFKFAILFMEGEKRLDIKFIVKNRYKNGQVLCSYLISVVSGTLYLKTSSWFRPCCVSLMSLLGLGLCTSFCISLNWLLPFFFSQYFLYWEIKFPNECMAMAFILSFPLCHQIMWCHQKCVMTHHDLLKASPAS